MNNKQVDIKVEVFKKRLTLPLWGEHQQAGPGEHGYCDEGQTGRTAHAQAKGKMDEWCVHELPNISLRVRSRHTNEPPNVSQLN